PVNKPEDNVASSSKIMKRFFASLLMNKAVRLRSTRRAEKARHPASPSSFSPATVGKRRCRGALHNCGDSAWDLADRASVVECGARAPLCLGLCPTVYKVQRRDAGSAPAVLCLLA